MHPPCIPPDEAARLMALARTGILSAPADESLDRVTRLAARALGVPIGLLSLVDAERQIFKSRVGLETAQTSRKVSFCGHAIYQRAALVVPDATLDERFADNPLVTGPPHIRAYAGVPLRALDGQPLGTLCVIDVRARDFSREDLELLTEHARIMEGLLHERERALAAAAAMRRTTEREELYRNGFELAAVGILHAAPDGRILRANPHASEMLGRSGEELRSLSLLDLVHAEDLPAQGGLLQRLVQGETHRYRAECRIMRKEHPPLWVNGALAVKRDAAGQPAYLIAVMEDISAKKQAEEALRRTHDALAARISTQSAEFADHDRVLREQIKRALESASGRRVAETRFRTIADAIPAVIGYWNRGLRCEFANLAYTEWCGLEPPKILGMGMRELHGEALFATTEPYARLALEGFEQRFELSLRKADGTPMFTDTRYFPDRDEAGEIRGFYVLSTDITELHNARAELEAVNASLRRENTTDYLTGLANRRIFTRESEKAASQWLLAGSGYGLILIDIDDFKKINDRYGHDVGDDVLRRVAGALREQLRERDDVLARVGGEEFAVLCRGETAVKPLLQLTERLRRQTAATFVDTAAGAVRVTCSFGIAVSQPGDRGWRSLYTRADAALYEAKAAGKNRVAGPFDRTAPEHPPAVAAVRQG